MDPQDSPTNQNNQSSEPAAPPKAPQPPAAPTPSDQPSEPAAATTGTGRGKMPIILGGIAVVFLLLIIALVVL